MDCLSLAEFFPCSSLSPSLEVFEMPQKTKPSFITRDSPFSTGKNPKLFHELIPDFMIQCSFSFLWFQCHYLYAFPVTLMPFPSDSVTSYFLESGYFRHCPPPWVTHMLSLTQEVLSRKSCSQDNLGLICEMQVTQHCFHEVFTDLSSRPRGFLLWVLKALEMPFPVHNHLLSRRHCCFQCLLMCTGSFCFKT